MAQEISTNTPDVANQPELPPASSWIEKTPGVCGGDACIRNTRIMVWLLVAYRQGGMSDQELLYIYPGLTADDLAAAWEYYQHNQQEIDEAIARASLICRDYLANNKPEIKPVKEE